MIFMTGDCHGQYTRFSSNAFPEQKEMTRDDFVIICGDFGLWKDDGKERYWLDWLDNKPFTTLWVDGNHENFDRLYSNEFPVVDFCGGKAQRIRPNIYHLLRGEIYKIDGKSIFAFGGASSHDIDDGILDTTDFKTYADYKRELKRMIDQGKIFRINHLSWWKEELPSDAEMEYAKRNLEVHGNKVDFIVSHCCPQSIASFFSAGQYKPDHLTKFFDEIADTVDFKKWFFGHYHDNGQYFEKYVLLYEQIVQIA